MKPIFLDRDGVLNKDVAPYMRSLDQLEIFDFTGPALGRLAAAGFDLFVISNQQGVALGITTPAQLEAITEALRACAAEQGAQFRKFYYCTAHDAEGHPWRKPLPGMIISAGQEFGFDPAGAFVIGDKWTDIEAARRAGCRPLLVLTGVTPSLEAMSGREHQPEAVFPTLAEAVDYVLEQTERASTP